MWPAILGGSIGISLANVVLVQREQRLTGHIGCGAAGDAPPDRRLCV